MEYAKGVSHIFSFIKAIDINSAWFQELWYPISSFWTGWVMVANACPREHVEIVEL
jgi:hypothetical protein